MCSSFHANWNVVGCVVGGIVIVQPDEYVPTLAHCMNSSSCASETVNSNLSSASFTVGFLETFAASNKSSRCSFCYLSIRPQYGYVTRIIAQLGLRVNLCCWWSLVCNKEDRSFFSIPHCVFCFTISNKMTVCPAPVFN